MSAWPPGRCTWDVRRYFEQAPLPEFANFSSRLGHLGVQCVKSGPIIVSTIMNAISLAPAPFRDLEEEFPQRLFVLYHPATRRYGCYCHNGVHGLAGFSHSEAAHSFAQMVDLGGMRSLSVSFEEAREIAKSRPMPVVSLILLDSFADPAIHYVR